MIDFNTARIHCSTIGYLMCTGRGKTPKQKYEDAVKKIEEWQAKYDALDARRQGMSNGLNAKERITHFEALADELAPTKDQEPLSTTAKSYLKKYYAYLKYGKWSPSLDKGNKYTQKGKLAEEDSITLLSRLDKMLLKKNDQRIQNEFLTGEIDIYQGEDILNAEYIYDVKTSWDIETFFSVLGNDLYANYWWQMQGYFALSNAPAGEVSYCLVDTPEVLLEEQKYYLLKRMNVVTEEDPTFKAAAAELVNNMTFSDMPIEDRRIKFIVERDDEAIQKVYEKVKLARQFLIEVETMHQQRVFMAKKPTEQDTLEETEDTIAS